MFVRAFIRSAQGAAAAEFALILPGMAFIFLNLADLGVYIHTRMQVDLAAQEAVGAARAACDRPAKLPATVKCSNLATIMQSAAQVTSLGSAVSLSNTEEGYYCASTTGDLGTQVAPASSPPASTVDCSTQVTGSTSKPGLYINTTSTYTYSPIFPGASIASLLPATISRTAWLRLA